jgi:hypothetical protein
MVIKSVKVSKYEFIIMRAGSEHRVPLGDWMHQDDYLMRTIPNLLIREIFTDSDRSIRSMFRIILGLGVVSAVYGGLHVSAWNNFFPTQLECYMWRISAIIMPLVGIIVSFVAFLVSFKRVRSAALYFFDWITKLDSGGISIPGVLKIILAIFAFPMWVAYWLLVVTAVWSYIGSRIFLVIEAFISLRELPIDVYKTPTWTQLIPHL